MQDSINNLILDSYLSKTSNIRTDRYRWSAEKYRKTRIIVFSFYGGCQEVFTSFLCRINILQRRIKSRYIKRVSNCPSLPSLQLILKNLRHLSVLQDNIKYLYFSILSLIWGNKIIN